VKDFFISYNKADRAWAEWIAWQLEQSGFSTALQAWDFAPGANFVLKMQNTAAEAKRTLAVLSPDYLNSEFTQPEWAAAFRQDPTGEKRLLMPVRVRECEIEGLLGSIIYLDLIGLDETSASGALLKAVQGGRAKPSKAPRFPGPPAVAREKPRFPGALPQIWNVPHLKNPHFTGRDEFLMDLRLAFTSGRPAASRQVIFGIGGVGKTRVAVEYAYRHRSDYSLVWWARAEDSITLISDYVALADPLNLPERNAADRKETVQPVRSWLANNSNWLLVLDNAADSAGCRPYLPADETGHILITSQNPNWRGLAETREIYILPRAKALEFLCKRTGEQDSQASDCLCNALGDLPVALEQAAAYMEATGVSIQDYFTRFETYAPELLRFSSKDCPKSVFTTWQIAFDQLNDENPGALDLLNLLAFLSPDDIERELLSKRSEHLPQPLASLVSALLRFDQAIAALRRYSLIEVRYNVISVHRLVQAVTRAALAEKGTEAQWSDAALKLIDSAFRFDVDSFETYDPSERLLPHALAVTEHAERLGLIAEPTGRLLNRVGMYLWSRTQLRDARNVLERALAVAEKVYGPQHSAVATELNSIGLILLSSGDLDEALRYGRRALAMDEEVYGPVHPNVARDLNNLGLILYDKGDLEGALVHSRRLLAINEKVYGSDCREIAASLNNMGRILHKQGDLKQALRYIQRALAINERIYGPEHPAVALDLNNIGHILSDQGDLAGALQYAQRTLPILEHWYGPLHPKTRAAAATLAAAKLKQAQPPEL
jgi:tetratricopeptide (TPR) repeat protein